MGLSSNWIGRHELEIGDLLFTERLGGLYIHDAIFVGYANGRIPMVIQKSNDSGWGVLLGFGQKPSCDVCRDFVEDNNAASRGLAMCCLDCFLRGNSLNRVEFEQSILKMMVKRGGTCSTRKCYPGEEVARRAFMLYMYRSFGKYSLFGTNCENFGFWCKTGVHFTRSPQVMRGLTKFGIGGAGFLPRYAMYAVYMEVLGPFSVIPISFHMASHRFRAVRHDMRLTMYFRGKRVSLEEISESDSDGRDILKSCRFQKLMHAFH